MYGERVNGHTLNKIKRRSVLEKQFSSVIKSVKQIDLFFIIKEMDLVNDAYWSKSWSRMNYPQCFICVLTS